MNHDPAIHRRDLIGACLATAAGLGAGSCVGPGARSAAAMPSDRSLIAPGDVVLFQGDSITDAGRNRERNGEANAQAALGNGYAWLAAAGLLVRHKGHGLRTFNRGISGNKVFQLAERWQTDCLDLSPNVVSVLIGVNDIWHTKSGGYGGTAATYERDYEALLARTRAALPQVKLVVCEPFVLRCGAVDGSWFPEFDAYRAAARRVAERHHATWVAFQAMFDAAVEHAPPEHWAKDGVHPSSTGAALMAQTWLDAVHAAQPADAG